MKKKAVVYFKKKQLFIIKNNILQHFTKVKALQRNTSKWYNRYRTVHNKLDNNYC